MFCWCGIGGVNWGTTARATLGLWIPIETQYRWLRPWTIHLEAGFSLHLPESCLITKWVISQLRPRFHLISFLLPRQISFNQTRGLFLPWPLSSSPRYCTILSIGSDCWSDPVMTTLMVINLSLKKQLFDIWILQGNELAGVIGGSGGMSIIPAVAQVFLNHFILGMEPLAAVQNPRVYHRVWFLLLYLNPQIKSHSFTFKFSIDPFYFFCSWSRMWFYTRTSLALMATKSSSQRNGSCSWKRGAINWRGDRAVQ